MNRRTIPTTHPSRRLSVYFWLLVGMTPLVGASAIAAAPAPAQQEEQEEDAPRTYADVITADAESDEGVFDVHRVDDTLYFEIPNELFGRDMLLVSRIAKVPMGFPGFSPAGVKTGEQVMRWERRGDQVLLRTVSFSNVADDTLAVSTSVQANNFPPITAAFDVEVEGETGGSVVIDVTEFYEGDTPALAGLDADERSEYQVRRLDPERSFINYARSYPLNVDVRLTLTYEAGNPPAQSQTGAMSMEMHHSMVLLPEEPLRPRYADPRVGYFSITQTNFGLDEQKAAEQTFIRRWRMEPSDPEAYVRGELVDPVKPIVYYIDPGTPEKWQPYVKQGVEDWQAAFETAGFSNAIVALDPPTPEEDPEWSGEDVRHSVVRWAANTTRNAQGPSVSDPRTGEIIESDIVWYHNHMRSYRNRLMTETGAANPFARDLDIPEELMGETMRQVIAHEVGHALGLPHNWIASSAFPVDSLRSPSFTSKYGVAASIMEYARQNYIAQPGDGVTRFVRMIGPYDHYSVNWGYRVIPDAETPEDEKPTLDRWILERAGDRMYRFGPVGPNFSPEIQTEDMGDDPVKASGYGIQNLKRILPNLPEWTATPGQDYADLAELYGELVSNWNRYTGHVRAVVGGVYTDTKTTDQPGAVYDPVPGPKQREAVQFLVEHVFTNVEWLNEEGILNRTEPSGMIARIQGIQANNLNSLLQPARMQRMTEAALVDRDAYTVMDMFRDLKNGIWTELRTGDAIDTYRRSLQRTYLERLATLMEDPEDPPAAGGGRGGGGGGGRGGGPAADVGRSDIRPLARAQLRELLSEASTAASRSSDDMTRVHLEDVVVRIETILDARTP